MTRNDQIANTIFQQLGGGRFAAMTGAKNFMTIDNGLRFKIGRNASKANTVEIKLNSLDLYDMTFTKFIPGKLKIDHKAQTATFTEDKLTTVREYHDIYCDQLEELFTETTGLYTRL